MVQGDNLNSRNDNKRCLTLDFKQPKRICKIQDKQQSPDWASSLALTTPELDDKALQLACQLDLLNGLPTPTTTSFLLSSPCTSTNGTSCLARSGNDALDNKPASSLTPTTDIERHLEQFQSLQTPLFEPIRDILTHSIANSPTDSQQTNITNTTTTTCNENIALSANNYQHQNNKDHRETDHHSESITDKQSNSSCPTTNIINTNINQRTDNQLQDNCNTADVLLPTPLFELDNDESEKNESCNGPSAAKRQCETRSHSEASTEDHMNHLMRHQNNQQNHNNSENDMLNVNIPLSVRRISDQSCSSSMDSSYSPKFLSLDQYPDNNSGRQQQQHQQQQQQQQQQPYLLLATDGNIFSSSPNQLNSMMDNQDKMKIERKRERNRLAASKCRKRKIDRITQLEEQVADLEERLKRANNELIRHKIRMAP